MTELEWRAQLEDGTEIPIRQSNFDDLRFEAMLFGWMVVRVDEENRIAIIDEDIGEIMQIISDGMRRDAECFWREPWRGPTRRIWPARARRHRLEPLQEVETLTEAEALTEQYARGLCLAAAFGERSELNQLAQILDSLRKLTKWREEAEVDLNEETP